MSSESESSSDSSYDSDASDSEQEESVDEAMLKDANESVEEEEDDVIKAIKREASRKNNHPPMIQCDEFITDISFHPELNILAVANIIGDVLLYKYDNDSNTVLNQLELHKKACRDIEFSCDGTKLFSVSKDKAIMISDVESGKLRKFYEKAHDVPLYCITVIDENRFATGDDDGIIKIWDQRQQNCVYRTKRNEDYISDMVTDEAHKYLVCSSGDGSLISIDLDERRLFMMSEEYDEEITSLGLLRSETKLVAGTSQGKIYMFNWQEFGLHSDMYPAQKSGINSMIPITENIVITACEDGNLRATHLYPHHQLGVVGQHQMVTVESIDICNDGTFIASSDNNHEVKFWNIEYFDKYESENKKHKKQNKKKGLANNLPSSKVGNVSDFFSGLM